MKKFVIGVAGAAILATSSVALAERGGEEVYNSKCFVCHAAGVAGAPKLGDKAAWAPRIAAGNDALLATAKTGKGAMPPMGTCADCTDGEMKAAIEFMVSKAK